MTAEQNIERPKSPGRPRSEVAHQAILDATNRLMDSAPIRTISIEAIAREAKVGKPTIYRWWESKCALVMDAFLAAAAPEVPVPAGMDAAEAISQHAALVVRLLQGRSGRIVAEIIGEGQSDADILEKFRERFFSELLAPARAAMMAGLSSGEIAPGLDVDMVVDLIYGPIYYRLLVGHRPLDEAFAKSLSERTLELLKPR